MSTTVKCKAYPLPRSGWLYQTFMYQQYNIGLPKKAMPHCTVQYGSAPLHKSILSLSHSCMLCKDSFNPLKSLSGAHSKASGCQSCQTARTLLEFARSTQLIAQIRTCQPAPSKCCSLSSTTYTSNSTATNPNPPTPPKPPAIPSSESSLRPCALTLKSNTISTSSTKSDSLPSPPKKSSRSPMPS